MLLDLNFLGIDVLTFVTALFDGKKLGIPHSTGIYDGTWVDKLYRGIERNYSGDFDLVCLVDKEYDDIKEPVSQVPFLDMGRGWICIIEKFRPDLTRGKRFTLGLDTIITSNIDDICSFGGPMGMISDTMDTGRVCNGITIADSKSCDYVWNIWTNRREWVYNTFTILDGVPSEMMLLRDLFDQGGHCPRLDKIYPNKIFSYKMQFRHNPDLLETASIVYFHGDPKPHQLMNTKLLEHWI